MRLRYAADDGVGRVETYFAKRGPNGTHVKIAMMRMLEEVEPEEGNKRVVSEFGNRRYQYVVDGEVDISDVGVPVSAIKRQVILFPIRGFWRGNMVF